MTATHRTGPPVVLEQPASGWVRILLNSPDNSNALTTELMTALLEALDQAESTAGCRTVVIASAADGFCSGLALSHAATPEWLEHGEPLPRVLFARLARSPLVTVALVEGAAYGGGVGLAAACDQVLVGPGGTFTLTETLLGLIPAIVMPLIAHRTGPHRALAMALTAVELDAEEAVTAGLADAHCEDVPAALRLLLRTIGRTDPAAVQALKRYHSTLYPPEAQPAGADTVALRERFADPATQHRLALFRRLKVLR
ncbi:enoyl-CoA hydratase-related protein [Streptomyces shenzhenensis]|uniref:enoyl-CoA hydratase-related protein n=1 Tax=Streptomyces shenzhenensis TaxID=943815 RepID=UPI00340BA120